MHKDIKSLRCAPETYNIVSQLYFNRNLKINKIKKGEYTIFFKKIFNKKNHFN